MASQTSHYKASTKDGFPAGELAALLQKHGPAADYKVVISFRGKVRELIVTEDDSAASCETPAPEYGERIPGGSMRRGWDGPRP